MNKTKELIESDNINFNEFKKIDIKSSYQEVT